MNVIDLNCRTLNARFANIGELSNQRRNPFPGEVLTFRPNSGINGVQNIYSDWKSLYSSLLSIQGPKVIYFDDTLLPYGDHMIIPAGNYNMVDTTWTTDLCIIHTSTIPSFDISFPSVDLLDGVTINGLCGIEGPLNVYYYGTTVPAITIDMPVNIRGGFILNYGATIFCEGTQPFIHLVNGIFEFIIFSVAKVIYTLSTTTIKVSNNSSLLIPIYSGGSLEDNTVEGDASSQLLIVRLAPGVSLSSGTNPNSLSVQPSFLGTIQFVNLYTNPDTYNRVIAPLATNDNSQGYKIGDMWIDTNTSYYIAVDVSIGAAVWKGPF